MVFVPWNQYYIIKCLKTIVVIWFTIVRYLYILPNTPFGYYWQVNRFYYPHQISYITVCLLSVNMDSKIILKFEKIQFHRCEYAICDRIQVLHDNKHYRWEGWSRRIDLHDRSHWIPGQFSEHSCFGSCLMTMC